MTSLPQPSRAEDDWTTETLRQHVIELFGVYEKLNTERNTAMDLRFEQRYQASEKALEAAFKAAKEAVDAALAAAERAVEKAENAAEKRLDSVNEFRGQLNDQALTLMPRSEAMVSFNSLLEKLEALANEHRRDMVVIREMADRMGKISDDRLKILESSAANMQGRLWALGTVLALVVIIVNIGIRFVQ